jgi:hypothetical protein
MAMLMVPLTALGEEPNWANVKRDAPPELIKMANSKRAAVFYTMQIVGKGAGLAFFGFFISGDGLALCPLEVLCWKEAPRFRAGSHGEVALKTPVVLAIFEEEGLALVKFAYKPELSLTLSDELAKLGTWVAILAPPMAPESVTGPILAHRGYTFHSKLRVQRQPKKHYSIAAPSKASFGSSVAQGGPIVDAEGEVVGIYSASVQMPSQTFAMAHPSVGLPARIEEAVKKGSHAKVPIPMEDQPFDPVIYNKEYMDGSMAETAMDFVKARKCAKDVVAKFPDSRYAKFWEYMMVGSWGLEPEIQPKLLEGLKVPEDAPAWERGIYQFFLGSSLLAEGKTDEAILALRKSDELYPEGMACGTLVTLCQRAGQLKEAELYARKATKFAPDRIDYWDALRKILEAEGKYKEADGLTDRIYLLEHLY